ncbi:MAG: hypothetical protein DMG85_21345 [Acidobacteria bacterium]|nr:MAG: hypothetical protein DMG85_21345 [Acidobacteriota bacterium]
MVGTNFNPALKLNPLGVVGERTCSSTSWFSAIFFGAFRTVTSGRVSRITIVKSSGSAVLDRASTWAFSRWVFTPGKWSAMIIPTAVRVTWVPVLIQERSLN